jgi:predicted NUDIX family NTP pyrophosphohydrolase
MQYKTNFKASGVLIYRYINNSIEILLGYDYKKKGFTIPGGKKEKSETAEETAFREFQEETGNIFDLHIILNLFSNRKIINNDNYVLFAVQVEDLNHATCNIENLYIDYMNSNRFLTSPPEMREMSYFKWFLLSDVLQYKINTTGLIKKVINSNTIRTL